MIRIIGCSLCSITEHEGRIIQSRSEESIVNEIEAIRDTVPGFTGVISDLGGPTANMYMLRVIAARRADLPSSLLRLSEHLRAYGHQPRADDQPLPSRP